MDVRKEKEGAERMQRASRATSTLGDGKGRGAGGAPTPAQIEAMKRAMPPGMLQQMQRAMKGGGGMQEMMKAMMRGQGGDQFDMEEMQRTSFSFLLFLFISYDLTLEHQV